MVLVISRGVPAGELYDQISTVKNESNVYEKVDDVAL
jgi:hypothetical protein